MAGRMGTCIHYYVDEEVLTIEFDDNIDGHSNGGMGKQGHCWNIPLSSLEEVYCKVFYKVESEVKLE